jgi:signal-transduction protein with cAMP-binding, CBS, and nucleotidyltransferase domain
MRTTINTIDADAKVIDATKIMGTSSYVIILEKGKPIGIITERDIIGKVLAQDRDPKCIAVTEIMSAPLITIDPDDDLVTASSKMREQDIGKLIVMRENIIYGVITNMIISHHFQSYVDGAIRDMIRWTPSLV